MCSVRGHFFALASFADPPRYYQARRSRVQPCTNQLRPRRKPTVLFTSVGADTSSSNTITERPQPPPLPPAMAATLQLNQQEGWPTISSNSSRRLIIPTQRMGRRHHQASWAAIRTAGRPTHQDTPPLFHQEPAAVAPAEAVPDQSHRRPRPTGTIAPRP